MRAAVPLLIALALAAAEPLTATAWDVRKDADELFEDLERRHGDRHDLLERARRMLETQGNALVAAGDGAAPLAQVLWQRLEKAGLAQAFVEATQAAAARRLQLVAPDDEAGLTALARSAPGTAAARAAWRRLADLTWDQGRLARFRAAALSAADATDPVRQQRLAAAEQLDALTMALLPASFAGLGPMWRLPLAFSVPEPPADDELHLRRRRPPAASRPALSATASAAVAISDGRQLSILDHLTGSELGSRISVGDTPLSQRSARPALSAEGFTAVGIDSSRRLVMVAADTAGRQRFRTAMFEDVAAISAPAIKDGVVAVAFLRLDDERSQLHLAGFSMADGHLLWDTIVTLLPAAAMFGSGGDWQEPVLEVHALGFAVLANAGVLGLAGTDGQMLRLWSYPSRRGEPMLAPGGARVAGRVGSLASDGSICVATPADQPGLVLALAADGTTRSDYRGDGADGEVVAVHGGCALLAGRQVTLLDLATRRPLWSVAGGLVAPWGVIGNDTVLLADASQLMLLARGDGRLLGSRAVGKPSTFAAGTGMLVVADAGEVRGFGDAADFLRRLETAIEAAPTDPRPAAALAGVLAGRGEADRALALYQRALDLGADAAVAERAARLLRARLDGPDRIRSRRALADLRTLAVRVPGLADELPLWQARTAEADEDAAAAQLAYRACLAGPDHSIALSDGLSVGLHLLARAGLQRLGDTAQRPLPAATAPRELPVPTRAWRLPVQRSGEIRVSDRLVVGYAGGLLTAWNLADGSEAWWRTPSRTMLGVRMVMRQAEGGVPVEVIPGTAAEAMGLRNGDVLLAINDQPINDFQTGLMPAVQALAVRAPVTFLVQRDEARLTLTGRLGGEPVEPLAISDQVVLARTTMPTNPQLNDLRFFVLDPATGAQLWTHTLPAEKSRLEALRPFLTPGGTVVAVDGADLVGLAARTGERRWAIPGRADLLSSAQVVGGCLWLIDPNGITARLVDAEDGRELAVLPAAEPDTRAPLLDGLELLVREDEGRLACWDLGRGRLRFRTGAGHVAALALTGGHVVAIDGQNRLAILDRTSGNLRRLLLDGAQVRSWAVGTDRLTVLAEHDGRQQLTGIAFAGGAPIWNVRLPVQVEISSLQMAGTSTQVRLRNASGSGGLLLLDEQGQPTLVAHLPIEPPCLPLAGGALAALPDALRICAPGLPPPGPVAPCPVATTPVESIDLQQLAWQTHPDGTWAAARIDGDLLLAVRGTGDIAVRLADALDPLAAEATLGLATPGVGTRVAIAGGWTLAGTWQRTDAAGQAVALSRWRAPAGRPSGQPLRVRIGADTPETPPWWWTAAWPRLEPAP